MGSGGCAGMGVKTEAVHTSVLVGSVWAVCDLIASREARLKIQGVYGNMTAGAVGLLN